MILAAGPEVNWWATVVPAVLGPLLAVLLGYLVARKVARRTAREEVGRSHALEEYPRLMRHLGSMHNACKVGRFPPTSERVLYGSERARRLAGVIDLGWWVRYRREGRDALLHEAVRKQLEHLYEVGHEYGEARSVADELIRSDLWPRIGQTIPPSAVLAVEQVLGGDVWTEDVGVSKDAIAASVGVLNDDSRIVEVRRLRKRLEEEIDTSREAIRKISKRYAP